MVRVGRAKTFLPRAGIKLALTAAILGLLATGGSVEAKTPGKSYCFNGICHRVKTLAETQRLVGVKLSLSASHYDSCKVDRYNPCGLTSSGERYAPHRPDNAASPIFPDGTKLLVWHPRTRKAAVVRINNAGPYYSKRTLDLSRATAEKLGFGKSGVSTINAKVISAPTRSEATYVANRKYAPVQGYIGPFESIEQAFLSVGRAIGSLFGSPAHAAAGRDANPPAHRPVTTQLQAAKPKPQVLAARPVGDKGAAQTAVSQRKAAPKASAITVRKAGAG